MFCQVQQDERVGWVQLVTLFDCSEVLVFETLMEAQGGVAEDSLDAVGL